MYSRSRAFRSAPPDIFKDYVPGQKYLCSEVAGWKAMPLFGFGFPEYLTEGPTPAVSAFTFGVVTNGNIHVECSFNDEAWISRVVLSGHITLIPSDATFNARWVPRIDNPPPVRITMAQLPSDLVSKIALETLNMDSVRVEVANHFNHKDPLIEQVVLAAQAELTNGNPCGPLYAETAAQLLALHMLSRYCTFSKKPPVYTGGLSNNQLRKVLDYIHACYHEEISLDMLAQLVGMSAYHFLRLFKQSTGQSPLQYIIKLRMQTAEKLLLATNLPVTQVAFSVGYRSISHFINAFRRCHGVTPAVYRKSI